MPNHLGMTSGCGGAPAPLAIDRDGLNQALTLGYSLVTGNPVVADNYEFFWQPPAPVYDPEKAKQLLTEAGFPKGFDGGDYYCDSHIAAELVRADQVFGGAAG